MSVIEIRKARREGARLVVGMIGVSSSGKTHTALLTALGLANGDPSKIGFIDTENRRGSLYGDVFEKLDGADRTKVPFLIGDLYPPFSPQRYIDAIQQFQQAGVEVLIIDSATHEWEGTGGCQEIAEAGNPRMPNWNKAKAEHKRFMNAMLQCDMHVILCIRAREKAKPEKVQRDGKTIIEYQDLGLQPITEKNLPFELTVSMMVHDQGTRREILKCPADLRSIFETSEKYLGVKHGRALREWVDGGSVLDPKVEKWRNSLMSNTEKGVTHIESCWQQTPQQIREALGDEFYATLKSSAQAFDSHAADAAREASENTAPSLMAPLPTDGGEAVGTSFPAEQLNKLQNELANATDQAQAEPDKQGRKPRSTTKKKQEPEQAAEQQKAEPEQAPTQTAQTPATGSKPNLLDVF